MKATSLQLIVLIGLIVFSCAAECQRGPIPIDTSLDTVAANPVVLNNRLVRVRAHLVSGPTGQALYGEGLGKASVVLHISEPMARDPDVLRLLARSKAPAVLSGTSRAWAEFVGRVELGTDGRVTLHLLSISSLTDAATH